MEKNKVTKTDTEREMEEYLRQNKDMFYKKSSSKIGSRINECPDVERIAIDSGFTKVYNIKKLKHLFHAGMVKSNGLNTVMDKERVINGSKDWMQKLV